MDLQNIQELEDELRKGVASISSADFIEETDDNRLELLFMISNEDLEITSLELEGYLRDFVDAYTQVHAVEVNVGVEAVMFTLTVDSDLYE